MLGDTSKFKVHDITYDNDGFAIARGYWEEGNELRLACRWHDDGIGYPQTFGQTPMDDASGQSHYGSNHQYA
jgi:hypothetical protein